MEKSFELSRDFQDTRRHMLPVVLLIDNSRSIEDSQIDSVNFIIKNIIEILSDIDQNNKENAAIFISCLVFNSLSYWIPEIPIPIQYFKWSDIGTYGKSNYSVMCKRLNDALNADRFINSTTGYCTPQIILISQGKTTSMWDERLETLKCSYWFQKANKLAFVIGDNFDANVISKFIGNGDSILNEKDIPLLPFNLRFSDCDAPYEISPIDYLTIKSYEKKDNKRPDYPRTAQVLEMIPEDIEDITGVELYFLDASVPPEYHRSSYIAITSKCIQIGVKSYSEVLAKTTLEITKEKYLEFLRKLINQRIRKLTSDPNDGICGDTCDVITIYKKNCLYFQAYSHGTCDGTLIIDGSIYDSAFSTFEQLSNEFPKIREKAEEEFKNENKSDLDDWDAF